jgi:hypothetical protein
MQIIDLVVEIGSQVLAGIVEFRLTRNEYSGRGEQEGPDYKGKALPMVVHNERASPGASYLAPDKAYLLVLIYED